MLELWKVKTNEKECINKNNFLIISPLKNSLTMIIMILYLFFFDVSDDSWIIDLGGFFHMNPYKDWLLS